LCDIIIEGGEKVNVYRYTQLRKQMMKLKSNKFRILVDKKTKVVRIDEAGLFQYEEQKK